MLSNDLKRGDRVVLRGTGWAATIADNKKGITRLADVEGLYREIGSVYVWDIAYCENEHGRHTIELTEAQKKARAMIESVLYVR